MLLCRNTHYVTSREMRLVTCCVLAAATCSKSANMPSTSCVNMACFKFSTSLEQVVNNLLKAC